MEEALKNFEITMAMMGNSYYRCDERIYSIPTDSSISIKHSMDTNCWGIPTNGDRMNDVVDDAFLSPYGVWSIQLKNMKNEMNLRKFENYPIDVQLIGRRGDYLRDDGDEHIKWSCSDRLDKV